MSKEPILSTTNICYSYPDFSLKNISFDIKPGEIIGFIGKNGAGKTTTIKCITEQLPLYGGTLKVLDYDLRNEPVMYKKILLTYAKITIYMIC